MNYDTSTLDIPGLKLLGDRQLNFLNNWAQHWDGVQMKAVLSQTPFYGGAHIHSGKRLKADLDSNGWPQTGRRKAVSAIRKGFAVHIAGDQHLATLAQHGIDEFRTDPISSSIVGAVYVRMWHPADEKPGANLPTANSTDRRLSGRPATTFHARLRHTPKRHEGTRIRHRPLQQKTAPSPPNAGRATRT